MSKVAVLLDTDIGSDIDDAVALAYLLKKPECELFGITTVTGDVQKRAALAEAVCRASGRNDVPIHCGRRNVLIDGRGQPNVPQFAAIADHGYALDRPETSAVEFLRQTIRSRPGEITLLTIGPYSNIALLYALDPEIPFLLKSVVSMGGIFFSGGEHREWNALVDPAATAMVYTAPRQNHLTVGLDVTTKCQMSKEEVRSRFVGEPLSTVASMAEAWFADNGVVTFHDPLAAALIFHPELCTYKKGRVVADPASGLTQLVEGNGEDSVAEAVNSKAFFDEYFDTVLG